MVVITLSINYVIQLKRQIAANWTQVNPILRMAEPGFESDTGKIKIGDGITRWNSLPYLVSTPTFETIVADGSITNAKIANNAIDNSKVASNANISVSKINGALTQTNATVTTASTSSGVVRNIYTSTSNPSGGMDGDVWMVYS
jgi:hypothetical protein